jgi:hypothetical protein
MKMYGAVEVQLHAFFDCSSKEMLTLLFADPGWCIHLQTTSSNWGLHENIRNEKSRAVEKTDTLKVLGDAECQVKGTQDRLNNCFKSTHRNSTLLTLRNMCHMAKRKASVLSWFKYRWRKRYTSMYNRAWAYRGLHLHLSCVSFLSSECIFLSPARPGAHSAPNQSLKAGGGGGGSPTRFY